MRKFFQVFLDGTGDASSKRAAGIALVAAGITGAFMKMDSANVGILVGAGVGLLRVTAVTKT